MAGVDFSGNAPVYDRRHGARLSESATRDLSRDLPIGAPILDLGAGTGRVSVPLAALGFASWRSTRRRERQRTSPSRFARAAAALEIVDSGAGRARSAGSVSARDPLDDLQEIRSAIDDEADAMRRTGDTMAVVVRHLTMSELEAGLDEIARSPRNDGVLEMIVRRPQVGEREILGEGHLDLAEGLVGDSWRTRSSKRTADGSPHPDMQLNLINSRVVALVSQDKSRWHLAGDQLFVDLDLSAANLPPGTHLAIGRAVIEVTAEPHTGCSKFVERFGADAMKFVNAREWKHLHLRGINARVVRPGPQAVGDRVNKL